MSNDLPPAFAVAFAFSRSVSHPSAAFAWGAMVITLIATNAITGRMAVIFWNMLFFMAKRVTNRDIYSVDFFHLSVLMLV